MADYTSLFCLQAVLVGAILGMCSVSVSYGGDEGYQYANPASFEFCVALVYKDSKGRVVFARLAGSENEMKNVKHKMRNADEQFDTYNCDQIIVVTGAKQALGKYGPALSKLISNAKRWTSVDYFVFGKRTMCGGEQIDVSELVIGGLTGAEPVQSPAETSKEKLDATKGGAPKNEPPNMHEKVTEEKAPNDEKVPSGKHRSAPRQPGEGPPPAEPSPAPR